MFNPITKILSMLAHRKLEKIHIKFMKCITENDIDGLHTYLKNGVDPNFGPNHVGHYARLNDLPPLFAASCLFKPEIVQMLLDYGVKPARTLTQGSDFDEKTPTYFLPTPHNCLEYFVNHMDSIDRAVSSSYSFYYKKPPATPEVVLQIYKSLRSCILLPEKLWEKMKNSDAPSAIMFAAWEQQQVLQKSVQNITGVSSTLRRM